LESQNGIVIATLYFTGSHCKEMILNELIESSTTDSVLVCPGDIVTYECTVFGGTEATTIWKGDFFSCLSGKRALEFVHSRTDNFSSQSCNDGNVVGRFVRIENDSFTSQLNITLKRDIAGKSIECISDNGTDVKRVGLMNLTSG
jgi:hypothetical protein